MLGYLNVGIKDKEEEIKRAVKQSFRETNGRGSITKNRYFELPKFDVNFDKSMVHLFIPYYISGVKLSQWLAKITGIDVNTEKDLIVLPEAPLTDTTLKHKMFDPMRCLTGIGMPRPRKQKKRIQKKRKQKKRKQKRSRRKQMVRGNIFDSITNWFVKTAIKQHLYRCYKKD